MKLIPYKDGYLVEFGDVLVHPLIAQELSKLSSDAPTTHNYYYALLTLLRWHLATSPPRLAAWWSAECEAELHEMVSQLTLLAKGQEVTVKFPPPSATCVFDKAIPTDHSYVVATLKKMLQPYQLANSTFVKVSYEDS